MHHMKKLINSSLILALLAAATVTASAKTAKGNPTDTTEVAVYNTPDVFADDVTATTAPVYNIFTSNI